MNNLLTVLTQNILPIFLVAAFGYALRRWMHMDTRDLSRAVFYCLSPCLVFSSLVNSQLLGDELLRLSVFTLLTTAVMGTLAWLTAKALRLSRTETVALLLLTMFVNGGNYGLTLNQLRYGEEGLARAIVYFVTSTVVLYSLGIFLASTGHLTWRQSLARLWRMPPLYAAGLALIVYWLELELPTPLMRGIEIAGEGAIPLMLLVLGMQLADLRGHIHWRMLIPALSLRLLLAPFIGAGIAALLNLQDLGRATAIIEASMPSAVFNIVLATEFDLNPAVVTSVVAIGTLISPLTVAATITFFGL